jgi:hypothetical protein
MFRRLLALAGFAALSAADWSAAALPEPGFTLVLTPHDSLSSIGDRATLRAEVTTPRGAPVAGATVVWKLGRAEIGRAKTDAQGHASAQYITPEGSHIGANTMTLTIDATPFSATANLAIFRCATHIAVNEVVQDTNATTNQMIIKASVVRNTDNYALPSRRIQFAMPGHHPFKTTIAGDGSTWIHVQFAPDETAHKAAYTLTYEGETDYLSWVTPQQTFVIPEPPPPLFDYAFYPLEGGTNSSMQLGQTKQFRVFVGLSQKPSVAVAGATLDIQACGGWKQCWPIGSGVTDAHGTLDISYTHSNPVPRGAYKVQVAWVRNGIHWGASAAGNSAYKNTGLNVELTETLTRINAPYVTNAMPGSTVRIHANGYRKSDQRPVGQGVLWMWKGPDWNKDRLKSVGSSADNGGGWIDLQIPRDTPYGHHVFYIAYIAIEGSPYVGSDNVPVFIDIVERPRL